MLHSYSSKYVKLGWTHKKGKAQSSIVLALFVALQKAPEFLNSQVADVLGALWDLLTQHLWVVESQ